MDITFLILLMIVALGVRRVAAALERTDSFNRSFFVPPVQPDDVQTS